MIGIDFGVYFQPVQDGIGTTNKEETNQGQSLAEPESLTHKLAHLSFFLGTKQMGDSGRHGHHHPHDEYRHDHPQASTDCDSRQGPGTEVARHHGVDKIHRDLSQLGPYDRQAQFQQGNGLVPRRR